MAFNNVFDSSLIDYSKDFETNDEVFKNKVEKGKQIMIDKTIWSFVNDKIIDDEFVPILEEFYNKLEAKLEKITANNSKYISSKFTNWAWDGIPDTVEWIGREDKECVKAFGVPVEDPYDEDKRNCDAYCIVDSYIDKDCEDPNGKVRKEIINALETKIEEYNIHVLEDQYL